MSKFWRKVLSWAGLATASILTIVGITMSVGGVAYADTEVSYYDKILMQGVTGCYNIGAMNDVELNSISANSLVQEVGTIYLPNNFSQNNGSISVNCKELLFGATKTSWNGNTTNLFRGVFSMKNKTLPATTSQAAIKIDFLENMGYVADTSSSSDNTSGKQCLAVKMKYSTRSSDGQSVSDPIEVTSNTVCASVDRDGGIVVGTWEGGVTASAAQHNTDANGEGNRYGVWISTGESGKLKITFSSANIGIAGLETFFDGECSRSGGNSKRIQTCDAVEVPYYGSNQVKWRDLASAIDTAIENKYNFSLAGGASNSICISKVSGACVEWFNSPEASTREDNPNVMYKVDDSASAASRKALNYLFGSAATTFYNYEKASLYQNYMKQYANVFCDMSEETATNNGINTNNTVKLYDGAEVKTCYYTEKTVSSSDPYAGSNGKPTIYGFGSCNGSTNDTDYRGRNCFNRTVTVAGDIVPTLNDLFADGYYIDLSKVEPFTGSSTNGGSSAQENINSYDDREDCYSASVKGVSWFVCPAIDNMKDTVGKLDGMINDWLEVDSSIYDSDSAVNIAWGIMRNIANTVIIVILLVIIFSQLTGYGIDNYGIKKMLPRLIVMAVIINLSFIICELAIDLSNLLGNGFDVMFRRIGETVRATSASGDIGNILENFVGWCMSGIYLLAGAGGAVAPTAITIGTAIGATAAGPMAVIIIVLALLVILVALILFFLMLGARVLIIIMCVTLAPVAFALAILPNTKSLTKRWWDLFKAALLIFPICGLVEGVSYLLKVIAATTPEVSLSVMVIVFLAPFLPFFLLPTMLRGAIAGLGRVGGALTSMGGVLRNGIRGTQSAVQSTDAYKTTMQEGRIARIRRHRGIGEDGKLTTEGLEKMRKAERKGGASFRSYMNDLAVVDKDKKAKDAARAYAVLAASETEIPNARTGYTDQAGTFHAVDLGKDFGDKTFGTDASGNTIRGGNREAYYANKFLNAAYSGDSEGMTAAISAAKAAGMKDKYLASMIRQTENRGLMNLGENEKRDWLQSARTNFGGVMATDAELGDWAARGGYATLGDYGDYAGGIRDADGNVIQESQMNFNDMNIDDIPKLSGDGLAGAIRGGLVTTAMARDALAQYGSSLSQDKKVMLGMMADGLIANTSGLDARRFKQEADAITRGVRTSSFVGNITNEQVGRWLQKPPQAVRLEGSQADVPIRGERGGSAEPDYQSLDDWNTGGGGGA